MTVRVIEGESVGDKEEKVGVRRQYKGGERTDNLVRIDNGVIRWEGVEGDHEGIKFR